MKTWHKILIVIGLCGICYYTGRISGPVRVETKIEEKIVYKETKDQKVDRKITKVKKPDGTITVVIDESKDTVTNKDLNKDTNTETVTDYYRPENNLSVFAMNPTSINPTYGVHFTRRFFGPITIGGMATHKLDYGVSIGLQF